VEAAQELAWTAPRPPGRPTARRPFWEEPDGERLTGAWLNSACLAVEVDFAHGRHYRFPLGLVPGIAPSFVLRAEVDEFDHGIVLTFEDGRTTDFASDLVLYHCEPSYRQAMDARFPRVTEPVGERVGRRVRELRQSRRLSLQELADKAGLTRGNASRLEAGKHEPRLETLSRVAEALGVAVADLVAV